MSNINIRNKVYTAIEAYNNLTIKYKQSMVYKSYNEKRGMFYTCLRRFTGFYIKSRYRVHQLAVDDIECIFRPDSSLQYFKVLRTNRIPDRWEVDYDVAVALHQIKQLTSERKEFLRTPIMNEIADIVSSIK